MVAPPRGGIHRSGFSFPPEYTRLKPGAGKNGGHIRAYMGSEVQLSVKTNKPVQEALIALADGWRLPLNPTESGDSLGGKMILGGAGSYQVRLKDAHGVFQSGAAALPDRHHPRCLSRCDSDASRARTSRWKPMSG